MRSSTSNSLGRRINALRHFVPRKSALLFASLVTIALVIFQWPVVQGVIETAADDKSASSIPWRTDLSAAAKEAKAARKPLLLDFTASWCPPCRVMKKEVWPDEQVQKLAIERFIPVLLDVDRESSRDATRRYGISSIPSILVTDADGKLLRRSGFMTRDQAVQFLRQE